MLKGPVMNSADGCMVVLGYIMTAVLSASGLSACHSTTTKADQNVLTGLFT